MLVALICRVRAHADERGRTWPSTCEAVAMKVTCCFCGEGTTSGVALTLGVSRPGDDVTQGLACHAKCLDQRLHPSVPRLHEA